MCPPGTPLAHAWSANCTRRPPGLRRRDRGRGRRPRPAGTPRRRRLRRPATPTMGSHGSRSRRGRRGRRRGDRADGGVGGGRRRDVGHRVGSLPRQGRDVGGGGHAGPGRRGELRRGTAHRPQHRGGPGLARLHRHRWRRRPGARSATWTGEPCWWPPTPPTGRRSTISSPTARGSACTPSGLTSRECRADEPLLAPGIRGGADLVGDHQVDNRRLVGRPGGGLPSPPGGPRRARGGRGPDRGRSCPRGAPAPRWSPAGRHGRRGRRLRLGGARGHPGAPPPAGPAGARPHPATACTGGRAGPPAHRPGPGAREELLPRAPRRPHRRGRRHRRGARVRPVGARRGRLGPAGRRPPPGPLVGRVRAGRHDHRLAAGISRQRPHRGPARAGRPHRRHRPLPQRHPARSRHRRRGGPAHPRRRARGTTGRSPASARSASAAIGPTPRSARARP